MTDREASANRNRTEQIEIESKGKHSCQKAQNVRRVASEGLIKKGADFREEGSFTSGDKDGEGTGLPAKMEA